MNIGDLVTVRYLDGAIRRPLFDIGTRTNRGELTDAECKAEVWKVLETLARWQPNEIGEVVEVCDDDDKYDVFVYFGEQCLVPQAHDDINGVLHDIGLSGITWERCYYFVLDELQLITDNQQDSRSQQ